jgi:apolipoprotein D and lipocalin family protein
MSKILVFLLGVLCSATGFAVDLNGVRGFEPERYLGTWYQIQSTIPFFQRSCRCAKADYTFLDERTLGVVNSCYKEDGNISTAKGKAVIQNPSVPSRLVVSFSPISFGGVNYVVTEVGENYDYAVIVSPGNSPIWILSRDKTLSESTLAGIRLRLVQAGVRINDLKDTDPNRCPDFCNRLFLSTQPLSAEPRRRR